MSIDRDQLLADVISIIAGASGNVATIRDAGNIEYPGEPFDPPDPGGDPSSLVEWLDLMIAEADAGGETFSVEMVESVLDFGVYVERKPGADRRGRILVNDLQSLFENQNTSTMQYYPERAVVAVDEHVEPWQLKRVHIPFERRESL